MDNQIANSFDPKTIQKIAISVGLSFTATLAIAILEYIGTIQINNPILALAVIQFLPVIVNAIKEYRAGIKI